MPWCWPGMERAPNPRPKTRWTKAPRNSMNCCAGGATSSNYAGPKASAWPKSNPNRLRTLDEELPARDAAIRQLLEQHPYLKAQRQLLHSVPGIGEKLSLQMLGLCHHFTAYTKGQGSAKQLVAFVGLDPQPHQSGKSHARTLISRQGSSHLRSQLYLGALGGVRGHNPLTTWYHHLLAQGKA